MRKRLNTIKEDCTTTTRYSPLTTNVYDVSNLEPVLALGAAVEGVRSSRCSQLPAAVGVVGECLEFKTETLTRRPDDIGIVNALISDQISEQDHGAQVEAK